MSGVDQLRRLIDWCREPSKIKVNSFHPSNFIIIVSVSIFLSSIILTFIWQQASTLVALLLNPLFWGGKEYESPRRILRDGDYIYVLGRTMSYGVGESNVFLLKYNLEGKLEWNVTWDEPSYDVSEEFTINKDAIFITGSTQPNSTNRNMDTLLLKYDKDGRLLWSKTWGGIAWDDEPSREDGKDIELQNDFVYIVGTTHHNSSWIPGYDFRISEQDVHLLKYDTNGEFIWQKQYGGDHTFDYGYCLEIVNDELYVTSKILTIDPDTGRLERLRLYKLDLDGNMLWNRTYNEISCDYILTPRGMLIEDGNIYITGGISWKNEGWRPFTSKFDLLGEFQWIHVFEEKDYYTRGGMVVVEDHILVMAGDNTNRKNTEVILFDYDLDGNLLGNFTWGTNKNETAWDMRVVGDTLYLIGQVSSSKEGVDIYLTAIENPYAVDEPESRKEIGIPAFSYISIIVGLAIGAYFIYKRGRGARGSSGGVSKSAGRSSGVRC